MKIGNTLRKGSWDSAEDALLRRCIDEYGEGKWHLVPQRAGLNRCRKSCRLRWLNYLRPAIKRGNFGADELDLIVRLHNLLGNRWSLIAGRLPGRTANDIKNYWSTSAHKKLIISTSTTASFQKGVVKKEHPTGTKQDGKIATNASGTHLVIKPIPRALSKGKTYNLNPINHISSHSADRVNNNNNNENVTIKPSSPAKFPSDEDGMEWSEKLFSEIEMHGQEETSSDGTLMAPWTGLEDMDIAARGRHIWMVDESTDPATEDNDWSDIWDFLNHDNN